MSKERLEDAKSILNHIKGYGIHDKGNDVEVFEWLIEQAERVQKLEEIKSDAIKQIDVTQERNERLENRVQELEDFKRSIEQLYKNYHLSAKKSVAEKEELQEQNKRYREIIEEIKKTSDDYRAGHFLDIQDSFFVDEIIAIINKLEGE